MVAAVKSLTATALGVSSGPESTVLVESQNIDVDSNIDFGIVGPCEAVEVTIVSGASHTGTPSIVFSLQAFDLASGTFITLVASVAMTDVGSNTLATGHTMVAVANRVANRMVRERMRLVIDYTGTPANDVLNGVTITASVV